MSLKTTLTALNSGIINNWLSQARRFSQNAPRYQIRTKRWSKGILFPKKPYIRKQRFSTVSQFAVPADYESDDVNTDEVPDQHKQFPITRKTAVKQSPDESVTHTTNLSIIDPALVKRWPMFSVLDRFGKCLPSATDPLIDKEKMIKMYTVMTRVQILDDIFFNAQRQGRISFYMQSCGEEATQIGSAAALSPDDEIFAQYREVGVLLWRGFTIQQAADQCFANISDLGKGRQMPVHYGSRDHHFQTISSPLATQLPQAAGAAYSMKLSQKDRIVICFFGEGAASEGDFHAGMNISSTLEVPMIFFCRNNGFAISTPTRDQYRGDGIISRAAGYGMKSIRVDGNDVLAVYEAVKKAREMALSGSCPVLIEAMTYRVGHHSTSDDSTKYRSIEEMKDWGGHYNPVSRLKGYITDRKWWDEEMDKKMREEERASVLQALESAEKKPRPSIDELFTDVYKDKPDHLIKQEEELRAHIALYPDHYNSGH